MCLAYNLRRLHRLGAGLKVAATGRRPGGRLLLTTPLGCWLHMEPFHYYGGFTPYWFEHWLPRHGFRLDEVHPQGGPGRVACVYFGPVLHPLAAA